MHCELENRESPFTVLLEHSHLQEVCDLEKLCYPSPWSEQLIRNEFAKDISFRLGLQVETDLVAYCFSYLLPGELHLLNLAVAPEYRGRGYGGYLLAKVLLYAIKRGSKFAYLEVRPSNEIALGLYRQLGFARVGVRRNYYQDNGEDALLFERELAENDLGFFQEFCRVY